jgi:hypothetical protein
VLCDRRDFADDCMSLSQNACASAFDDLLTGAPGAAVGSGACVRALT